MTKASRDNKARNEAVRLSHDVELVSLKHERKA
jgi:hypothetical protein